MSYKPRQYSDGELALLRRLLVEGPLRAADLCTGTMVPGMAVDDTAGYLASSLTRLVNSGDVDRQGDAGLYTIGREPSLILRADQRRPLVHMRCAADTLVSKLGPLATRLEIAGSIRRQKADCGDIELCAITDGSALREALIQESSLTIKSGSKYTQAIVDFPDVGPVTVDLFITADPTAWGMLLFIRTGSADFVKRALAYWKKVSDGGECRDLHLYRGSDTIVATAEEADVFRALGTAFIAPERRIPKGPANG